MRRNMIGVLFKKKRFPGISTLSLYPLMYSYYRVHFWLNKTPICLPDLNGTLSGRVPASTD